MEDEIISKLKSALNEPIQKECQVVYILVEIRKLLEKNKIKANYPVLNFYCNWALHSYIENIKPQIRTLLEEIEKTINSSRYDLSLPEKMLNFELFKKDIKTFFANFSIDYNLDSNWITIRKLLIDIISDCPLKFKNGNIEEFKFIHSEDYKTAECIISFRNRPSINIGISFMNY